MNLKTFLTVAVFVSTLSFCAPAAKATTVNVSYSLTGASSGDPFNPPLVGNATGTLTPFGAVTWADAIYPDLSTGSGDGTFTMTFGGGDTLFGTLHLQGDFSTYPIVPFTQALTVTGGTGSFLGYRGSLAGLEISDQSTGLFNSTGSGTLTSTPEPGSLMLLGTGIASLLACRKSVNLRAGKKAGDAEGVEGASCVE